MKIDFSQSFKTLGGRPIPRATENGEPGELSLSQVACDALMATYEDEKTLSGEEKVRRFTISTKIYEAGEVDLDTDEISLIKRLVGKAFAPIIVGQAHAMLERKPSLVRSVPSDDTDQEKLPLAG